MESGAPLSEAETRHVVAEAIKLSNIPLERLLDLLRDEKVTPNWDHMFLPPGRTMAMVKNAFEVLFRPSQSQTFQPIPHIPISQSSSKRKSGPEVYEQRSMLDRPPAKRRQSAVETKSLARELAPKPSNGSPGPTGSMTGKTPKKRGRPSKADVERNKAEAIARGVIMAPMTTMPTGSPKLPVEEASGYAPIAPNPPMPMTGTFYDPTVKTSSETDAAELHPGDSPGKKKRKPAVKPKPPATGQSSFAIQQPMTQQREYEPPQASNSMANILHGPVPGSTERQASTTNPLSTTSEHSMTRDSRSDN